MKSNVEIAKSARIEAVTSAKDFGEEWHKKFHSYKSSVTFRKMESPLELVANIAALISERNSFGERFDEIIIRLDETGKRLILNDDNEEIIVHIYEGMKDVFEESKGLDIDINLSGDIRGNLGETKFQMADKCEAIKKSWQIKYNNVPNSKKNIPVSLSNSTQQESKTSPDKMSQFERLLAKKNEILATRERESEKLKIQYESERNAEIEKAELYCEGLVEPIKIKIDEEKKIIEEITHERDQMSSIHFIKRNQMKKRIELINDSISESNKLINNYIMNRYKSIESLKSECQSKINGIPEEVASKYPLPLLGKDENETKLLNELLDTLRRVGKPLTISEIQAASYSMDCLKSSEVSSLLKILIENKRCDKFCEFKKTYYSAW